MRILGLLLLVTAVSALPRKPTKDFPKKYNAALDGLKNTYGTYERAPDEDLVVPVESFFLGALSPPSSYDAYFERQPQDPILPPVISSYADVVADAEKDRIEPPPVDTYSAHPGKGHIAFVPPPTREVLESYLSHDGEGQESLAAPPLSSYAETPKHKGGADILASLAAMVHSLPQPSSYHAYESVIAPVKPVGYAPSLVLSPPNPQAETKAASSSYSETPEDQTPLTSEQIKAAKEASVAIPQSRLLPPL